MRIKKITLLIMILLVTSFFTSCSVTKGDINVHKTVETPVPATEANNINSSGSPAADDINNKYDQYLLSNNFSGTVLVAVGGRIVLSKGYGMADYANGISNSPQMKFNIASVSKQFTAMAIMQLHEKGLLDVKDNITKFFPQCKKLSNVTIHQLLTHTSGVSGGLTFSGGIPSKSKMDELKETAPGYEPGSRYSYSNDGYYILGCIIEKVSGKSYGEYLDENIFKPLGMRNTEYKLDMKEIKNRAEGYNSTRGGAVPANTSIIASTYAAGGIFSSVEDLYLWDRALYTEKLVKQSTLDQIFQPWELECSDCGDYYGYGWVVKTENNKKYAFHTGANDGFRSCIKRCMDDGNTVIVLSNDGETDPLGICKGLFGIME